MLEKGSINAHRSTTLWIAAAALVLGAFSLGFVWGRLPRVDFPARGASPAAFHISTAGLRAVESQRLTALAAQHVNLYGSTAVVRAGRLTPAQTAEGARLQALAGQFVNLYGSTAVVTAATGTPAVQAR